MLHMVKRYKSAKHNRAQRREAAVKAAKEMRELTAQIYDMGKNTGIGNANGHKEIKTPIIPTPEGTTLGGASKERR